MIPDEYKPMVNKLLDMTKRKLIEWETTSDSEKFTLDLSPNTIAIQEFNAYPDNELTCGIDILNKYGEKIDGVSVGEKETDFKILSNLFEAAKRNALKIDETISQIMNSLNLKDPTYKIFATDKDPNLPF